MSGTKGRSGRKPDGIDPSTGHGPEWRGRILHVLRSEPDITTEALMERFGLSYLAVMHYRGEASRLRRARYADAAKCTECGGAMPPRPSDAKRGGRGRLVCSKRCLQTRKNEQERQKRAGTYRPDPLKHPRKRMFVKRVGIAALECGYRVSTRYRDSDHATWTEAREVYRLRMEIERAEAA